MSGPLLQPLPAGADDDALLDAFLNYVAAKGIDLYPAQEQAILELLQGNNVILKTPTGSGKSLVAAAMHFFWAVSGTEVGLYLSHQSFGQREVFVVVQRIWP